jgi:glycerophosphoryl diester phosphodiesterase
VIDNQQPSSLTKDWPFNIAHRGGRSITLENTLEGFREGLRVGAGALKLNVHTTADERVVVIHDDFVDRTTEGQGAVREMTLAEIKRLDAGYRFARDGGRTFPYRSKEIKIPTLEEVYEEFSGVPIIVDIKGERSGIEEAVWRVIKAKGTEERTLVASSRTSTISRFREVSGGRVATGSSLAEQTIFYLLSRVGLSRLSKPRYQALQVPESYFGLRIVTPWFIRAAHERGLRVDVWAIDSRPDRSRPKMSLEADVLRMLGYGVDSIITDRPDVLARV